MTGSKSQQISPARHIAFGVLIAVDGGAYASDRLRGATLHADSRDAGLASQIVFGTLRFRKQLDYLAQMYSGRPVVEMDLEVATILRMAIYQLRYLDRIPVHAAVHEAVEMAKIYRRAASGLVNAVLRKVSRNPVRWPDRSTRLSCPEWLMARWDKHFGSGRGESIAEAALVEPADYIRVAPGDRMPDGVLGEPTNVPGAIRVVSGLTQRDLRLHDIGSQSIIPLLELEAGNRYLDVCSAPGNKTQQAFETPLSLAIACDVSFARLLTVHATTLRVVLDGTVRLPFPPASFDRIFVDAPCSGTGTISRNPEIKWRVQAQDFKEFGDKQRRLIERALPLLAPKGKLLYATCSLEREENESTVASVRAVHPRVTVEQEVWRLPGRDEGDGFFAALLHLD